MLLLQEGLPAQQQGVEAAMVVSMHVADPHSMQL
jgi:hypothetical protein